MATNIYSLVATYVEGGQFAQNVLHYEFDDSSYSDTATAALALANAFDTTNTTHLRNLIPTTTQIASYKGRSLTTGGGFEAIKLLGAVFGLRSGNLSVSGVCPVAVMFPLGNAKPRGRCFLPGITDTDLVNGEYTTAFRNNFTTHAVMFTNTLSLSGGGSPTATPIIYHRKPAPAVGYIIEYVRLSDTVGQLFRRQRPA
jgi:hypothetical protein